MKAKATDSVITFIDKKHRAIYMTIDGCPVTISFSKQGNNDMKEIIGEILEDTVVHKIGTSAA